MPTFLVSMAVSTSWKVGGKDSNPFFTSAAVSVAKKTFSLLFDFEVSFPGLNLRNHFFAKKLIKDSCHVVLSLRVNSLKRKLPF